MTTVPAQESVHGDPGWGTRFVLGAVVPPYTAFVLVGLFAGGVQVVRAVVVPGGPTRTQVVAGLLAAVLNVVLVRDRLLARLVFLLLTRVPPSWPFTVRAASSWLFHLGGLHAGWSVAATAWAVLLAGDVGAVGDDPVRAVLGAAPLAVLLLLVLTAIPVLRRRHHDVFDVVHASAPPVLVVLLWWQVLDVGDAPVGAWAGLIVVTGLVVYPELVARRAPFSVVRPSRHVALATRLDGRPAPGPSATKFSRTRFGQRHGFVNVPGAGGSGWRIVVSRAGDWTGRFIDDPPPTLWIRSLPAPATGPTTSMWSAVVVVVTGSGIGPALAYLHRPSTTYQLVWVTRSPVQTFGRELVDEVRRLSPDALIIDTTVDGKPDLGHLVSVTARRIGAEAVVSVTNRSASRQLNRAVRRAGLVSLSPTWDS